MSLRKIFTSASAIASTSSSQPFAFHLSSRAASSSSSQPPSSSSPRPPSLPSASSTSHSADLPPHLSPKFHQREPRSAQPNPRQKLKPTEKLSKNRIFITNLPFSLPDDTLGELFFKLTDVSPWSVQQPRRKKSKKPSQIRNKGFGFVEWEDVQEGWDAVRKAVEMSGKVEVEGRTLTIVQGTVPPPKSTEPKQRLDEQEEEEDDDDEDGEEDWDLEYTAGEKFK
ncbi:hypothetical protein BDY24DRAFT_397511 [Mrakia frigida]|uniref:uncharacterized protein n=1 Tax=Mrakia frigida TaxID=29902 RepID=UPI003FCC022C